MPRYVKGQSGNPAGRPKGAKNKREKILEMLSLRQESLFERALSMAESGDPKIMSIMLERILPPKPRDSQLPEYIEKISGSPTEQADKVLDLIYDKEITPSAGNTLLDAIQTRTSVAQVDDLVKRVAKLEELLDNK